MNNIQTYLDQCCQENNPAVSLIENILSHSNSHDHLIFHLENIIDCLKKDREAEKLFFSKFKK